MIDFYYNLGPNPMKVALFLEEAGLDYNPVAVDMLKGEQFSAQFTKLNPNSKAPVIVDGDVVVFDSNAILLYLAEKTGQFLPQDTPAERGAALSWLMFIATGLGPYSGQSVHFRHYAPAPKDYAEQRYLFEAGRHYEVLNTRLADRPWLLGDDYTFVDMALWGWARNMSHVVGPEAPERFPEVARLVAAVNARPAAQRIDALRTQHAFKQQFDDEAKRTLFRHIAA
jgi:GST-like protein